MMSRHNKYPTVGGVTQTHNNNGSLTGDTVWTFGYNAENMLTSAVKTGTNASFVYDPFLRQTQKTVGSTKTKYVYSGSHLMEEYNGATNALLRRYVYAGAEEPIFQIASNGTVTYLHHDHLGSVIAQANASGVVGNKYKYSPWGESPSLTGTTIGYTAQRWDSELSQYNYRARYYRPSTGRFLQTDPVGYKEDLNLYTFVKNDPLNQTDLDGLKAKKISQPEVNYLHFFDYIITNQIPHLSDTAIVVGHGGFKKKDGTPYLSDDVNGAVVKDPATIISDVQKAVGPERWNELEAINLNACNSAECAKVIAKKSGKSAIGIRGTVDKRTQRAYKDNNKNGSYDPDIDSPGTIVKYSPDGSYSEFPESIAPDGNPF